MNATEAEIYAAIYLHLEGLSPTWRTKKLGVDFAPGGNPYQRITFLPTPEPDFAGFGNGRFTRNARLIQVDVFYPKAEKRTDLILARAELVRARFWPTPRGLSIAAGASTIDIEREPVVGPLMEDGDSHLQVPVTVTFSTDRGPAG